MENLLILTTVLFNMGVSLGVGSSTLAILSFFYSIADGTISPEERRLLGVIYLVLRIAMVIILMTTLVLIFVFAPLYTGTLTLHSTALFTGVLFVNALLMTYRIMPSTFGPSIQAATWYTLGITSTLYVYDYFSVTILHLALIYVTLLVVALVGVNGVMKIQKKRRAAASLGASN